MSIRTAFSELFAASEPIKLDLRANLEQPTTGITSPAAFNLVFPNGDTSSGEYVNEQSALQILTVYACVRLIAETIATLPLRVKESTDTGTRIAEDHSLTLLFSYAPNPDMSPAVFIETLAGSLALTGNAYAEIIKDSKGNVLELYPRNPLITEPMRLEDGSLGYTIKEPDGITKRIVQGKNMLHIPLFSWDGLKGLSPIGQARSTLGLTVAAQKSGARYFGNGSRPGGILAPKTPIDAKQGQQMREYWEQQAAGINQGRIAVLPSDWTYTALGMSLEDSQFLQTRQFQRAEIAALWRVPSHMVGDTTRLSNSNHEQSSLSLIQDCLAPYLVKIEQEFQRKLLPPTGRALSRFSISFDLTERLRTDLKTTLDSLAVGRQWGLYSANDGRQILGLNPIGPEGDIYLDPVNMLDAKKFADWLPSKPAPAPEVKSHVVFAPLVRDSIGRLNTRTNRTAETFSSLFGPALNTIAAGIVSDARSALQLDDNWQPNTDKIITDCLKSIEHRSASWGTDLDATAQDETGRIYKALRVNIYRDAGATMAVKELKHAA